MLIFNIYSYKNKKSKLYFGDCVAVLNNFIYQIGGVLWIKYLDGRLDWNGTGAWRYCLTCCSTRSHPNNCTHNRRQVWEILAGEPVAFMRPLLPSIPYQKSFSKRHDYQSTTLLFLKVFIGKLYMYIFMKIIFKTNLFIWFFTFPPTLLDSCPRRKKNLAGQLKSFNVFPLGLWYAIGAKLGND
jgi:hypothetical protein